MDEPASADRLWQEFKLKASADARELLILYYSPLVKYVAGRVSSGCRPISNRQIWSPTESPASSMPSRNTTPTGHQVRDHAISRIKGAIIDELRAIDWIPRSVRFKAREVEKAYAHLENRLHRTGAINRLAEREIVITLYHYEGLTWPRSARCWA